MNNFKYSIFIFIGACSYGILASIVKTALTAGHSVWELTGSQYLFGFLLLLLTLPFIKRVKISFKQAGALMLTGTSLALTGIFYGLSLERVSASLAIVLLFQFTWIGIAMEAIYERKMPSKNKIFSVTFLILGTIFASNLMTSNGQPLQIDGLIYGLLSAVTYATFIFASGKVATGVPSIQRSIFITLGGLIILSFIAGPILLANGVHVQGLWKYSLAMAFFGAIFPIVLFAIGTPKIDAGLATIVGSAELPAAIITAMIILGEKISSAQSIGIVLILIGIAIPQLRFIRISRNRLGT
ncbi:EamA family transporter [Cytobacillus depressus]|uniref:EamA family transporter n=1 Tax=Cytobacillus depressus TaxID=1602942 RepID=A0A6L3V5Q9_9BACI|nr:DMT family transporter [Cytobacillus depressus]KAB2329931.1 EamA family transporter [Cytobacillus depressus]